MEGYRPVHPKL